MRKLLLFALCFAVTTSCLKAQEVEVRRASLPGNKDLVYRIPEKILARVKPWDPSKQEPPLPITKAVVLAQHAIKPSNPSKVQIIGIELSCVSASNALRWYYFISAYDTTEANRSAPPESHDVLIAMNGEIVRPVIEPSNMRP